MTEGEVGGGGGHYDIGDIVLYHIIDVYDRGSTQHLLVLDKIKEQHGYTYLVHSMETDRTWNHVLEDSIFETFRRQA